MSNIQRLKTQLYQLMTHANEVRGAFTGSRKKVRHTGAHLQA
jgi:hypothetical protein